MKILMIGGTGQIGYYALRHLSGQGHQLAAVGLEPEAPAGCLPAGVAYVHANIEESTHTGLVQLLTGTDVVIHAAGADGRNVFPHPAIEGFRKANVSPFHPLIKAMLTARCSKLVVLGSYYTAMHRVYPRLRLTEFHPYIRSRQEQQELVMQLAGSRMEVVVLELPYIFGVAPGKKPLWNFITDALNTEKKSLPVHRGGTACITLNQAGLATAKAATTNTGNRILPIGNNNHSYEELYRIFARAMNINISIEPQPPSFFQHIAQQQQHKLQAAGMESAYHPLHFLEAEDQFLYIDPLPSMQVLGYGFEDIATAIEQTTAALAPPARAAVGVLGKGG